MREVEEENRQIRLQLSQSQGTAAQPPDGNYGNQQWGASADTGPEDGDNTAEEKNNHTECPRSPTVQKCEVTAPSQPITAALTNHRMEGTARNKPTEFNSEETFALFEVFSAFKLQLLKD